MAPETLVFMPNGDVTLSLIRNVFQELDTPPRSPSGLSTLSAPETNPSALEKPKTNGDRRLDTVSEIEAEIFVDPENIDDAVYFAPDAPETENRTFYPPTRRARDSDASSRRDRSSSPPASFWAALKRQEARVGKPLEEESTPTPAQKLEKIIVSSHEVHCVVSSMHLMLASPIFKTILSGDFSEAITLKTKGHVLIPMSADLDAMIILLNIIHNASRKVPREVSIELLNKLAVAVNYLGISETVHFFSDTWLDNLESEGLPNAYDENVLPLLFIFWVFDRQEEFKQMTRLTQRESDETIDEHVKDVPIPHSIIDAIKRDREFAMETAITTIHSLITRYMDGKTICDASLDDESRYACDAMVLGSLMKSSRKMGIWPKPETPFSGLKFKDLALSIRGIRILDVCHKSRSRRLTSLNPTSNSHGLEDSIEASMKSIESGLDGLNFSDYPKKRDDNSAFRMFLLSPKVELHTIEEQPAEDNKENFQIYLEEEVVEDPKAALGVTQFHPSVPQTKSLKLNGIAKSEKRNDEVVKVVEPVTEISQNPIQPTKTDLQEIIQPVSKRELEVRETPKITAEEVAKPAAMERRESSRYSLSQHESTTLVERPFDEKPLSPASPAPHPITQPDAKSIPPKEEVKHTGGKKMQRANSISKTQPSKHESKLPIKETPVVPQVTAIEAPSSPDQNDLASSIDNLTDNTATTEEGEMRGALPQNFKMRRNKKKFSTKF